MEADIDVVPYKFLCKGAISSREVEDLPSFEICFTFLKETGSLDPVDFASVWLYPIAHTISKISMVIFFIIKTV
ncbi:hypothetical protein A7A78_14795 [Aequorivita soesokkakensis]|uniref:Uncharacterized protein n=1 Tax=Aequorivita soesokkakensis TaxID=1385699 RepID=A0A1A9LCQ1_9FLAO|nr:hypothetical protein A7A78_14795 [Aequorivita soesokkakensis]